MDVLKQPACYSLDMVLPSPFLDSASVQHPSIRLLAQCDYNEGSFPEIIHDVTWELPERKPCSSTSEPDALLFC
jgi:hypothetical protein